MSCNQAKSNPLVSVIVPVYNVEDYLSQCLDSILNQTISDFEVICVNDGSTDSSNSILIQYASDDFRVQIVNKENGGLATARDCGIEAATGKYLCFVDSDDFVAADYLELTTAIAENDTSDIVLFSEYFYDDLLKRCTVKPWVLRTEKLPHFTPFSYRDIPDCIFQACQPQAVTKLFRTMFIKEHPELRFGHFRWAEDYPFTYTALVLAKHISFIDKPLYYYRYPREGSLTDNNLRRNPLSFIEPYKKLYSNLCDCAAIASVESSYLTTVSNGIRYEVSLMPDQDSIDAIAHYMNSGGFEFLGITDKKVLQKLSSFDRAEFRRYIDLSMSETVDIIVPIFNDFEKLESFFAHLSSTDCNIRIIVIDDASTDERVWPSLSDLSLRYSFFHLEQNSSRIGMVASTNKGIMLARANVAVVSVNVECPNEWLERLVYPIYGESQVACAVPYSNAASPISFANWWHNNPSYLECSPEMIDNEFSSIEAGFPTIPFGSACCFALNKRALTQIGSLSTARPDDLEACNPDFELDLAACDWCFRASEAGYKTVLVDNLFVYKHFSEDAFGKKDYRAELIEHMQPAWKAVRRLVEDYEAHNSAHPSKERVALKIQLDKKTKQFVSLDNKVRSAIGFLPQSIINGLLKSSRKK